MLSPLSPSLLVGYAYSTYLAEAANMASPTADIFKTLIVVLAIPLSIGMLIKNRAPQFALRMESPVRIASSIFLAVVILGLLIRELDLVKQYVGGTLGIVTALNAVTMGMGYALAKGFGLNLKQGLTIAIESGIQNGTLTISLAVITLNQPDFAIVAAIYSLVMYALSTIPIYFGISSIVNNSCFRLDTYTVFENSHQTCLCCALKIVIALRIVIR